MNRAWQALFLGNHTGDGKLPNVESGSYSEFMLFVVTNLAHDLLDLEWSSFVVHDRKEFVRILMPKFFAMSKFSSFQRQLNLYGFERITHGIDTKGGSSCCIPSSRP